MATVGHVSEEEWEKMDRRNKRLTWDDLDWLINQCTTCSEVGAEASSRVDMNEQGQQLFGTQIVGDTANMAEITDKTIGEGRFLLPHEVEHSMMVVVIGYDLRDKFFPGYRSNRERGKNKRASFYYSGRRSQTRVDVWQFAGQPGLYSSDDV